MDGNFHPQEGIVNEEERARKREKNIKKRRTARVCIVVNFLNSHLCCSKLQENGENGSKKCENRVGTGENRQPHPSVASYVIDSTVVLRFVAASRFQSNCRIMQHL